MKRAGEVGGAHGRRGPGPAGPGQFGPAQAGWALLARAGRPGSAARVRAH